MCKKRYFMVGMPESGKTTYLVSLYCQVAMGIIHTLLRLEEADVPEGETAIENSIENLLGGREVGRTLGKTQYDIQIPLADETGKKTDLMIPDLSGEIFRDFVHDRRLLKSAADRLKDSDEVLFFLNTNTMAEQKYLSLMEKSAMKIVEENEKVTGSEEAGFNEEAFLEPKYDKTNQSEVVDLLQGILFVANKRMKIKFIVSAWDKVEKEYPQEDILPEDYIERKLPLLSQYMRTNTDKMKYQVWGVSAQGGDFCDEKERARILEDGLAESVKVVDSEGKTYKDLTRILYM